MNLELSKGSKWPARFAELARELSGGLLKGGGQAEPTLAPRTSVREWKVALIAQLLVVFLLLIDRQTGIHFHFAILYLVPITFAALLGGMYSGLLTSATCTAAWLLADVTGGGDYGTGLIPYWKTFSRLVGFSAVAFLLARSRELNQRLSEKAQGLSLEVEKRKRTEKIYADEKEILEQVACDKPLAEILEALTCKIEEWEKLVCSLFLFDAERNRFICAVAPSFPPDLRRHFQKKPLEELLAVDVTGTRESEGLDLDLAANSSWVGFRKVVGDYGLWPQASKPIRSATGELLGILCLFSEQGKPAGALDMALFEKARDIATIAIERSRLSRELRKLSELIIEAQEAERRRIARELHDSVNQMLSSVIFRFGMIESQILGVNDELKDELSRAKGLLTRGLDEIHRISDALRPSELDALGLVPAVRSLCDDFQRKTLLEIRFESKLGPKRLGDTVELTLYRIIQEALSNIERHAGASEALLSLGMDGKQINLSIRDNGKGMESTSMRLKTTRKMGMGLLNMRERTAYLGGTFLIRSPEGKGTEICARIPIDRSAKKESEV